MTSAIYTVFVGVMLLYVTWGAPSKCNCNCQEKQLVCGKNNLGSFYTFLNTCQLQCQNCLFNERWTVYKAGECPKKNAQPRILPSKEPAKASKEPAKASKEPAKASKEPAKASKEPQKESREPSKTLAERSGLPQLRALG